MAKPDIEKSMIDGRLAERHSSVKENGDEIVEYFREPAKELKLEKRIIKKHEDIVSEIRTEHVKDGEIVEVEVQSIHPEERLRVVDHIGIADYDAVHDNRYVSKNDFKHDFGPVISDAIVNGVVTGMHALMENMEYEDEVEHAPVMSAPVMSAAAQIEERVENSGDSDSTLKIGLGAIIFIQCLVTLWVFFG